MELGTGQGVTPLHWDLMTDEDTLVDVTPIGPSASSIATPAVPKMSTM